MKRFSEKFIIASMFFILVLGMFALTASIEFNRTEEHERQTFKDEIQLLKTNFESIITSRMRSIYGLVAYTEISNHLTQEEYSSFAKGIFESTDNVVLSMSFITDTTITHVYPYEAYKSIVGTDLLEAPEQRNLVLYGKENLKSLFTAPVKLIEGGQGIIVWMPVVPDGQYYGQVSIVFDYDTVIDSVGITSLADDHYIELSSVDSISKQKNIIWSNIEGEVNDPVEEVVDLYDSSLTIKTYPKKGWHGTSSLFYLIIAIGFLASSASFVAIYKLLSIKHELETNQRELSDSNVKLMSTNEALETTINALISSKEQLKKQFEEIKAQETYIQFLADHDSLTELYNRRKFVENFEKSQSERESGAVMLLDIDNFKNINDTLGHIYGDKVINHVANLLSDALPEHASAYRLGGDEFLVLLPREIETHMISKVIENIMFLLGGDNEIDQISNHITLSLGVARYPMDGDSVEDILIKADIAMYHAKKSGKNQYQFFNEKMISEFGERIHIENHLRKATELEAFLLYYQPVIDAKTGAIAYFEALLRLSDFSYPPDVFISVAEDTGLIIPIGKWVVREAVSKVRSWLDAGLLPKPVAINLSPKQIYEASIVDYLEETLKAYDVPASLIEIEITENVLMDNQDENIKTLERLKGLGFKIALDDFGTGYSSLNYLTYVPVDKIKLDKSLKDKFIHHANSQVMDGLISIAHGLNLKVVAEGVETVEEYEKLVRQDCDLLQGYLFSKPVSHDIVVEMLSKKPLSI